MVERWRSCAMAVARAAHLTRLVGRAACAPLVVVFRAFVVVIAGVVVVLIIILVAIALFRLARAAAKMMRAAPKFSSQPF